MLQPTKQSGVNQSINQSIFSTMEHRATKQSINELDATESS